MPQRPVSYPTFSSLRGPGLWFGPLCCMPRTAGQQPGWFPVLMGLPPAPAGLSAVCPAACVKFSAQVNCTGSLIPWCAYYSSAPDRSRGSDNRRPCFKKMTTMVTYTQGGEGLPRALKRGQAPRPGLADCLCKGSESSVKTVQATQGSLSLLGFVFLKKKKNSLKTSNHSWTSQGTKPRFSQPPTYREWPLSPAPSGKAVGRWQRWPWERGTESVT